MVINFTAEFSSESPAVDFTQYKKAMEEWEANDLASTPASNQKLFPFNPNTITKEKLDSLAFPAYIKNNLFKYRESGGIFYRKESIRKLYGMTDSLYNLIDEYLVFENTTAKNKAEERRVKEKVKLSYGYFDPNIVSEKKLLGMGFNQFQSDNLIKYREMGAVFYKKKDLLKVYGIDSSFFEKIEPWIKIDSTLLFQSGEKNRKNTLTIEINQADSASLIKLYGVGPVFASRIIKYRNLLGGFAKKEQIAEVYGINWETYNKIANNIVVDTFYIQKLSLNFSDYNQLARHPYLKQEQVEKILEIRNNSGPFETCRELISKNILNKEEFEKVRLYLKIN